MVELTKRDEDAGTWYPVPVHKLEDYLGKLIEQGNGYTHVNLLRKDLAYNLQYLQFQDRLIQDIKLSSVLYTQSIKTIVLVSCSLLESLTHFLLIKLGHYSSTEWKEKVTISGNQKKLDGQYVRIDTTIYEKLTKRQLKHMTLDAMLKCAKSKRVFGTNSEFYDKLNNLRILRNRVHLQVVDDRQGTDWTSFGSDNIDEAYTVIHTILTSSYFSPSREEREYFVYLLNRYSVDSD